MCPVEATLQSSQWADWSVILHQDIPCFPIMHLCHPHLSIITFRIHQQYFSTIFLIISLTGA